MEKYYSGNKIGNIQIIKRVENYTGKYRIEHQYLIKCDCGNEDIFSSKQLYQYQKTNECMCEECYYKKYNRFRPAHAIDSKKIYEYNGIVGTLNYICNILHKSTSIVRTKMQNGMTLEEALDYSNKNYLYKGIKYSKSELLKMVDFPSSEFYRRKKLGWSIEKIIETPYESRKINTINKIYVYKEFTGTLKEICKHFNKRYNTAVGRRLKYGDDINIIMDYDSDIYDVYEYNGIKGSTGFILREIGMFEHYSSVRRRLRKGLTFKEAVEKPFSDTKFKEKSNEYKYKNFSGTLREIYDKFNTNKDLSYNSFIGRYNYYKDIDSALNKEYNYTLKNVLYDYNGEKLSLKKLCKKYNKTYSVVLKKIKNGEPIEKAINYESKIPAPLFTYQGETKTLNQFAKQYHTQTARLKKCIKKGMSIDEAIESRQIINNNYEYNGVIGTRTDLCNHFNVKYGTVSALMSHEKIDFIKALDTILKFRQQLLK